MRGWPIKFGLGLGLALLLSLALRPGNICHLLCSALLWIQAQGAAGVIAYIGIYNLATVLFVPGALLTLGGGALYGVLWGSVYALGAATLGATLAFAIGRYLAQGAVWRRRWPFGPSHPYFQALDAAVTRSGFKIVLLTRLSPILPFNLLNYAYGMTQVSLKHYLLGSLGMVPGTVMYVYLGALVGDVATLGSQPALPPQARLVQGLLHTVGLVATAAATLAIARCARHTLQQTVPQTSTSPKP
ncbi:MAG: TVP38/TMEM64 family protein [Nodosilinea sp.]